MKHLASFIFVFSIAITLSWAQRKERQLLSGSDGLHPVQWDFFCTQGRKSGEWTKINVPAHWEHEGFGHYDYGRDYHTYGRNFEFAGEQGLYRHTFKIPANWKGKEIALVFEGVMTDAVVKVNGQLAGPIHQGAFYQFRYDVTDLVKLGEDNLLEVTVSKMSSNTSVNRAERYADYWVFGGIYRPVYLEAVPRTRFEKSAIVAQANGDFQLQLQLINGLPKSEVQVEILDNQQQLIGKVRQLAQGDQLVLNGHFEGVQSWTSETPTLYQARISLMQGKKILFTQIKKFGFRTIEIKEGDGVYINGTKIKFKGINRHCFWPETGRAISPAIDLMDIQLIKEMNMNAVRCSHYPPDQSFLDLCDSLGLYVIDELGGWQNAYDTEVGAKLVKEMVERDVNHPSIIFWSNGNEGGTNKELDDDFDLYDPSHRPVIHAHHRPGNDFNGIDTNHYESYESTQNILNSELIFMPTEFLHGQDDGGIGASLKDYWELMWSSERSAGGFLWALLDEGIVRTDLNGAIDVNRLNAPDGVLGPHREKEGSFYALKEIWSPVQIKSENIQEAIKNGFSIENRYHFTNLSQCKFEWHLVTFPGIGQRSNEPVELAAGQATVDDIAPGAKGVLQLEAFPTEPNADALYLTAVDPFGKEIFTWSWPLAFSNDYILAIISENTQQETAFSETEDDWKLEAAGITVVFDKKTGQIRDLPKQKGPKLLLSKGPAPTSGEAVLKDTKHFSEEGKQILEMTYEGDVFKVRYIMHPSGWLEMTYTYQVEKDSWFPGITFTYPESNIISARWLGNGPYRVWKNRMEGGKLAIWENLYNDTQTGYSPWIYPEFKGYFSDIQWIQINTSEGAFVVAAKEPELFVRLFDFSGVTGPNEFYPQLPAGNLSFLDAIPPVGNKLATGINDSPKGKGPSDQPHEMEGVITRTLYFYFDLPKNQQ